MQPSPQPDPEFVDLIQRVLDGEASDHDVAHLNERLPRDPAALQYLVEMRMLHGALEDQWDTKAGGLSAIDNRIVDFPGNPKAAASAQSHPATKLPWQKILTGIAAVLVISLGILAVNHRLPAFEVVARAGSELSGVPNEGDWIRKGGRIALENEESFVELRSSDGNTLTFQGPGVMKIHNRRILTLNSGRLWADLDGEAIQIQVPYGVVTDIGTKFGIDQSSPSVTRIDVIGGEIQFSHAQDSAQAFYAVAGESLVISEREGIPKRGNANLTLYRAGLLQSLATFAGSGTHVSGTGTANDVAVGDSVLYTNMGTDHYGVSFDALLTINAMGTGTVLDASLPEVPAIHLRGNPYVWVDATLTFIQRGSSNATNPLGNPLALEGVTRLTAKDIDSYIQGDISDVFGLYHAPGAPSLGAGLERGGFVHPTGLPIEEFTYSRMRRDLLGSPTDWRAETDKSAKDPDFFVTYAYPGATLSSIRFVWGTTTTGPNDSPFNMGANGRGLNFDMEFTRVISE